MMKLDDISNDIKKVNHDLSDRIDKLEIELEKRLTEKLSDKICQQVDKRINAEIKRVNKAVDEKLDTVRADVNNDMDEIQVKLISISDTVRAFKATEDISNNIILRKLPETNNEHVVNKVQTLIHDILKLSNIEVVTARRVKNDSSKYPGVVVATLQNSEARDQVLKAKSALRNTPFKDIYIDVDRTREERLATQNLRTVVDAMNKGAQMSIRGNRVVLAASNNHYNVNVNTDRASVCNRSSEARVNNRSSEASVNNRINEASVNNRSSESDTSNSDGGLYSSILNSQCSNRNPSYNSSGNNRSNQGHWGQGRGNHGQGGRARGRGFQNNNNNRGRRQQQ
jgi:hypothetical protein